MNTWNKGVTLATWLRAFYSSSLHHMTFCLPLLFTILLFLHDSLPLFFFLCPCASIPLALSLSLSASPSVPVCRYIPSPLAAFVADNRGRAGEMSKTEGWQKIKDVDGCGTFFSHTCTFTQGMRKLQDLGEIVWKTGAKHTAKPGTK